MEFGHVRGVTGVCHVPDEPSHLPLGECAQACGWLCRVGEVNVAEAEAGGGGAQAHGEAHATETARTGGERRVGGAREADSPCDSLRAIGGH